ncbi:hypothetical protein AAG906_025821 [Vitis piasezkii]
MIVGTNNKIIIIKRVNFKEKAKDVEAITQQLIDQSRQTSSILNVTDVIGGILDLDESFHSSIKFGDNSTISIMGKGKKTIGVKWVYKTKLNKNGEVDKHKERLVAKGYKQEFGLKIVAYLLGIEVMHYFLGIEVMQPSTGVFISQKKYVREILDKFQMKDCNPVNTPFEFGMKLNKDNGGKKVDDTLYKQIMGSLMYLMATRLDIMHVVSVISRYMECPIEIHLLAAKRIFQYLQGTKEFGLFYKNEEKLDLFSFIDSDYVCFHDGGMSCFMVIKEATSCHITIH